MEFLAHKQIDINKNKRTVVCDVRTFVVKNTIQD